MEKKVSKFFCDICKKELNISESMAASAAFDRQSKKFTILLEDRTKIYPKATYNPTMHLCHECRTILEDTAKAFMKRALE